MAPAAIGLSHEMQSEQLHSCISVDSQERAHPSCLAENDSRRGRQTQTTEQRQEETGDKDFPQPFQLSKLSKATFPRTSGSRGRLLARTQFFTLRAKPAFCHVHGEQDLQTTSQPSWSLPLLSLCLLPASSRHRCLLPPSSMDSPRTRCLDLHTIGPPPLLSHHPKTDPDSPAVVAGNHVLTRAPVARLGAP